MPLGGGVRWAAKRISPSRYVRLAYRGDKLIESKFLRYKHPKRKETRFEKEVAKEHREHPWTTSAQARRIVFDHRRKLK